jgi:uncharacterized protein (TIGR00255 family)
MLQSMTGFASQQINVALDLQTHVSVTLTLKTLNSRFFETTCKFPTALSALETDLIALCKSHLRRGHLFFTISISPQTLLKTEVDAAMPVVASYMAAIKKIQAAHQISGNFTISDLLQLPHVFTVEDRAIDQQARAQIMQATEQLLATLTATRTKEGSSIIKDIGERCAVLTKHIAVISTQATKLLEQRKADTAAKIQQLTGTDTISESQRVALYNDVSRIDVHEEVVRFKSHLSNLQAIVTSADVEKGKRLDFTLQEMVREVNTIASKSSDATIAALVIDCKVELEKIREQVQNVV